MKTGIIIACYEDDDVINAEAFIKYGNTFNQYHFCFLNIGSSDRISAMLYAIKKMIPYNVSIVDVKKNAHIRTALKAGYRYLHTRADIERIGFIEVRLCKDYECIATLVKKMEDDDDLSEVTGTDGQKSGRIRYKNLPEMLFRFKVLSPLLQWNPITVRMSLN